MVKHDFMPNKCKYTQIWSFYSSSCPKQWDLLAAVLTLFVMCEPNKWDFDDSWVVWVYISFFFSVVGLI